MNAPARIRAKPPPPPELVELAKALARATAARHFAALAAGQTSSQPAEKEPS
jgi:hypothetical protein